MDQTGRVQIRLMTEGDLAEVFSLELASFADPWSVTAFALELRHNPHGHYQVLCLGTGGLNDPDGTSALGNTGGTGSTGASGNTGGTGNTGSAAAPVAAYCGTWLLGDVAQLVKLAVVPAWRQQGWGRCLFLAELCWARDCGARQLLLEVRSRNTAAVAFYTALGLERLDVLKNYYQGPSDDALVLGCAL
ncbi:MAG: GNAT family N-acetyltransferase [Coriobacteriales bacterium]|jgi:ribosomal protein S18 acetylase RimI-like enzyme|nr:GNAT family N-acetyltransferase [Coriobacteriales bacterium]